MSCNRSSDLLELASWPPTASGPLRALAYREAGLFLFDGWAIVSYAVRMEQEPMTVERLLRLALDAVNEGTPLQQSLLYPQDEKLWLAAVHAFTMALPDLPPTALNKIPRQVVIESLERAIEEVSDD